MQTIIDEQTVKDLEFDLIRIMLHDMCNSSTAKAKMAELAPFRKPNELEKALRELKEFHRIRTEGYSFPAIDFDELLKEIKLLSIPGSVLPEFSFLSILSASRLVNDLVQFFKKEKGVFEELELLMKDVYYTQDIIKPIEQVFSPRGDIKDEASPALASIRKEIVACRRRITRQFNRELKNMTDKGLLGDVKEAYLQNRRVLAIQSSHKRKVNGIVQGTSKTGNLTYIEPQSVVAMNHELEMVHDDERKEIRRILAALTESIRGHVELIESYQKLLVALDFINAKCRLAIQLKCSMPSFQKDNRVELIEAYHPILLLTNEREGNKTFPQSLTLDLEHRMLVISGPNAGGKSITLKTVGLLQLMFQSGLMIPADQNSKLSFFRFILTDIGDNQSIENQLSTYSYRLKRMKHFLDITNKNTLLLLDEFGTGSDPDLGGALAEVFFEELYKRNAFGVITTHYSNIKLRAANMNGALNGSMLFDKESLEPLFKLDIGQPGSSFTFEVAEINGIPQHLIEDAISRLDDRKVKMDRLIADLQKEKAHYRAKAHQVSQEELKTKTQGLEFERLRMKYEQKELAQQKLIEENNLNINRGRKLSAFINAYEVSAKGKNLNKELLAEVNKYIAMEKAKIVDAKKAAELKAKSQSKKKQVAKPRTNQHLIKVGSTVKLINGKEKGTVLELDAENATVAFGVFKTKVRLNRLNFVR